MKTITKILYATFAVVILVVGVRMVNGAPGDLYASINGTGNGGGFIYRYTPNGTQTTFAAGLSHPRGLAFDSAGNLFVATNSFTFPPGPTAVSTVTILKIAPNGAQSVFATIGGYVASDLEIDRADNVFVLTYNPHFNPGTQSKIYKFTPRGARMAFGFLPGFQSFGLAFDSTGNLFAASTGDGTIYRFAPDGTRSVFVGPASFSGLQGPFGLAFDQFGNLFASTETFPFNNDAVLEFTPGGLKSTFATALDFPRGLVFDSAGNLFVADVGAFGFGAIIKIAPAGTQTVFASGIGSPNGNGGPEYLAIEPASAR